MGMVSLSDIRAILSELIGTMFFVFLGTGSVVAALALTGGELNATALLIIATGHGIGIVVAVATTAHISGGHINPIVTIAMIVTRNIGPMLGVLYIVAQAAGAILGSLLLLLVTAETLEGNLGAHGLGHGIATGEGLLLEIVLSTFLVMVIFNVAVAKRSWGAGAPIAIGLAVMLIHLVGVPFTGASVNTARSLGPAIVANEWSDFWIYIVGPGAGGLIAALAWMSFKQMGGDADEGGA
ncbi:MAG: aquaporin [Dehalococcoidia bacterium]|nr:aquaporin [Dehalococcoidia bacterium]|tara:strand:- start:8064 stop:8780 length:717 start_codon:yes stop_codon:yes gene_type:complete